MHQKDAHHHECAQAEITVVTEDRQSTRLQAEKLQADMEGNEKFVFEAWDTRKTTTRSHPRVDPVWQRLGPPWRSGRKPCMLPFRHRRRMQSLRVANAEARISASEHLEQKVSERELTRAAAEAAEEVEQLENQEAAANEIESHKNIRSAALQEIETEVSWTGMELNVQRFLTSEMRRQFPELSAQLSSLRRDLHEIPYRSDGRSWRGPRTVSTNRELQQQQLTACARCGDLGV